MKVNFEKKPSSSVRFRLDAIHHKKLELLAGVYKMSPLEFACRIVIEFDGSALFSGDLGRNVILNSSYNRDIGILTHSPSAQSLTDQTIWLALSALRPQ